MEDSNHRVSDLPAMILLGAFFWVISIYLQSTNWAGNLELMPFLTIVGFLFGVILGRSKFDQLSSFWLFVAFTLVIIPLAISFTLNSTSRIADILMYVFYQLGNSVQEFSTSRDVTSVLLVIVFFSIIFWSVGVSSAFFYIRQGRFLSVLVFGFLFLILIDYFLPFSGQKPFLTGIAAFLALLFYIRAISVRMQKNWEKSRYRQDGLKDWTFHPVIVIISLALVFIAWSVPVAVRAASPGTPESVRFSRFSYQIRDKFERLTASLRGSSRSSAFGFGPGLNLGDQISSDEAVVFTAESSTILNSEMRIYWRGKVYEKYVAGNWQEGEQKQIPIKPDVKINLQDESQDGSTVTYRIKVNIPLGDYFIPGELISINNPGFLIYSPIGDEEIDIIAVEPASTILNGNGYRPKVWIKNIKEETLKASSDPIPEWVMDRYLQLPISISPRIKDLAEGITSGLDTPYEKAVAITEYLRSNYTYSEAVTFPTDLNDRIEWFLFDSREGFCNYFATAEVLLLRAIGIPARLAVGFSQGEVTNSGRSFTIRRKNSHAWPEVYFPGAGWVVFEPTPSLPVPMIITDNNHEPVIQDSLPLSIPPNAESIQSEAVPRVNTKNLQNDDAIKVSNGINRKYDYFLFLVLIGLVAVFGLSVFILFRNGDNRKRISYWISSTLKKVGIVPPSWLDRFISGNQFPLIDRIFKNTVRLGEFAGVSNTNRDTPSEKIKAIINHFPTLKTEGEIILEEYHQYTYGGIPADDSRAINAFRHMRKIIITDYYRSIIRINFRRKRGK